MASGAAHRSTGWAAGTIAAAIVEQSGAAGSHHVWSALAFLMAFSGGTAPDWMEVSWWARGQGRHSWITHRTWTHWGVPWLLTLWLSYELLPVYPWLSLVFGFAAGGVTHLLADAPNPLGVPWLFPTRRISLNLWRSGRCDLLVVGSAWLAALAMVDRAWLNSRYTDLTLSLLREKALPEMLVMVNTSLSLMR
jgi:membrane-bound metal-dependent hydrolase YbcI (DUF457 family)